MNFFRRRREKKRREAETAEQAKRTLIEDLEADLKAGELRLKCTGCGHNEWLYLEMYRTYQCKVCGRHMGRSITGDR